MKRLNQMFVRTQVKGWKQEREKDIDEEGRGGGGGGENDGVE